MLAQCLAPNIVGKRLASKARSEKAKSPLDSQSRWLWTPDPSYQRSTYLEGMLVTSFREDTEKYICWRVLEHSAYRLQTCEPWLSNIPSSPADPPPCCEDTQVAHREGHWQRTKVSSQCQYSNTHLNHWQLVNMALLLVGGVWMWLRTSGQKDYLVLPRGLKIQSHMFWRRSQQFKILLVVVWHTSNKTRTQMTLGRMENKLIVVYT